MDSAEAGSELNTAQPESGYPTQAPFPLPAGPYTVRATHTEADDSNRVGLVQILPADS